MAVDFRHGIIVVGIEILVFFVVSMVLLALRSLEKIFDGACVKRNAGGFYFRFLSWP